ncbi:hypothetical protein C8R47DRAFT_1094312 [Mycena vitilis]|nr:hypothetical protein C8R47DRAFT_1094312 [Mycena vitilis]
MPLYGPTSCLLAFVLGGETRFDLIPLYHHHIFPFSTQSRRSIPSNLAGKPSYYELRLEVIERLSIPETSLTTPVFLQFRHPSFTLPSACRDRHLRPRRIPSDIALYGRLRWFTVYPWCADGLPSLFSGSGPR